jgi:uncharacterized protein (TIGR02145 family)
MKLKTLTIMLVVLISCSSDEDIAKSPELATTAVTDITQTGATSGGNISSNGGADIIARGVVWSTSQNPTIALTTKTSDGTGIGSFTSNIADLTPGTSYFVRAYATNSVGTSYGNEVNFTTGDIQLPVITTTAISDVAHTTATSGGNITTDGGGNITARGVVWSTSQNPTIALTTKTSNGTGTGSFTSNIADLTPGTSYFVRAYATNSAGTAYGNEVSFTTNIQLPAITTTAISDVTQTTAISGGNITSDGGGNITARGVIWSTLENPTIALTTKTSDGTGTGSFTSNIADLTPGTSYFVRAYATNSAGTAYGNEVNFTTENIQLPLITTTTTSDVKQTTAISGGNITSDGGDNITARGIVWSTAQNPTIALTTKTSDGTGTGSFTSNILNLSPVTTYYVRAFATNSVGTAYGDELQFTTTDGRDNTTAVVDVTNPVTGRVWMDRNLGASRVAISSTDSQAYGDWYQWGRGADGHEKRNTPASTTLSSTDQPGHGWFIVAPNDPGDWRSPQNSNLWQGINGVNNPCPSGYRLPTDTELNAERLSWTSNNTTGAFASPLKLSLGGSRNRNGSGVGGTDAQYWSSTVSGNNSRYLRFNSSSASLPVSGHVRAVGLSVRCIKD